MRGAADAVKAKLPEGTGFVVLAIDDTGIAQYIANRNRADIVKFLRETADRLACRGEVSRVDFPGGP